MIIQCQFRMNISRDKQDFWSKVWQQKLCDLRISRGRFFAPYFGGQKLDLYAEKYGSIPVLQLHVYLILAHMECKQRKLCYKHFKQGESVKMIIFDIYRCFTCKRQHCHSSLGSMNSESGEPPFAIQCYLSRPCLSLPGQASGCIKMRNHNYMYYAVPIQFLSQI